MAASLSNCDHLYGLLLAAGASRRLGRPKQLLVFEGQTLVQRAVTSLSAVTSHRPRVVVQDHQTLGDFALKCAIEPIFNARWRDGMGGSIAVGVAALPKDAQGVLITTVDQPLVSAAWLRQLIARWTEDPGRPVACAYAGTVGIPALFPRSYFPGLRALGGDRGAKSLLTATDNPAALISCPDAAIDIDTVADWQALRGLD